MATKSILKQINVRDKIFARNLINALENAEGKGSIHVEISKSTRTIGKGQVKSLFGKVDD